MKIRVTKENLPKIKKVLDSVNGKASKWTVNDPDDVLAFSNECEKKLSHIPQKDRPGAHACYIPGGPSAKSYSYRVKSTIVFIERGSTGWFFTGAATKHVWPQANMVERLNITPSQAELLTVKLMQPYTIVQPIEDDGLHNSNVDIDFPLEELK